MSTMWTCPKCQRFFRNANQYHSCDTGSLEDHFINKPSYLKEIYNRLIEILDTIGPTQLQVIKSAIYLKKRSTFVAIKARKDHLMIEFSLNTEMNHAKIEKTMRLSNHRVVHVIHLAHSDEIDQQLIQWLGMAYSLCA